MQIRRAVLADAPAILQLASRYATADAHEFDERAVRTALLPLLTDDTFGVVIVAERDQRLHGYAVLTWGYGLESGGIEALLDEVYAEPQGQGIGASLIAEVVRVAGSRGARTLFLETEAANDRARAFYAGHGFAIEDSVWMRRDLSR